MYKKGPKQSIAICEDTRKALEKIKRADQKRLGLRRYSWNDWLFSVANRLKEAK